MSEDDVRTTQYQTHVTREEAIEALAASNFDVMDALTNLSNKNQ